MVKYLINFFPAFLALLPQFLSLEVSILWFLQPEPDTTNAGQIRFLIGELNSEQVPEPAKLWKSVSFADDNLM